MTILIALAALGGLTLILAAMLILANRKLYVYEDPRIDIVEDMLPHANCGACGYPGCRPFAEALVSGNALPGKCTVSSEEGRVAIAGKPAPAVVQAVGPRLETWFAPGNTATGLVVIGLKDIDQAAIARALAE